MEVSGQLHVPVALLPGKEPPVPIGQRLGRIRNKRKKIREGRTKSVMRSSNASFFYF
jgi:hypothetical protein